MQDETLRTMFEQAKESLLINQAKETNNRDIKLLATPMQQLLPEIFEEKRAIPNCFLRGALFGIVKNGKRNLVENQAIFSMTQYKVNFSGSELDQNDLEVWDTLIYLASQYKVDNELHITLYEFLKTLRMPDTGINRKTIISRIKRLAFGQVNIKIGDKEYFGSLIDDGYIDINGSGKLIIRYNKRLTPLFTDKDFTFISVDIRNLLGSNQLARWLYNFYESHSKIIPLSINYLQELCRSKSEPKEFKRLLKHSLELVKKAHLSVNNAKDWNYTITDNEFIIINNDSKKLNYENEYFDNEK